MGSVADGYCSHTAQVETLLKTQEPVEAPRGSSTLPDNPFEASLPSETLNDLPDLGTLPNEMGGIPQLPLDGAGGLHSGQICFPEPDLGSGNDFSWEMIGLGLEEPLPAQDVIDEL